MSFRTSSAMDGARREENYSLERAGVLTVSAKKSFAIYM
jgi:hypothetical protein